MTGPQDRKSVHISGDRRAFQRLTWAYVVERATGIEPAPSVWKCVIN
jgi:hypothetical protein